MVEGPCVTARDIDEVALDRALVRKGGLREFVRLAWPIVEPGTPYVETRHVAVVCDHLQAVTNLEIRSLLVNIPPGCSKSKIGCVMWPVWDWLTHPHPKTGSKAWRRFMFGSFDLGLAMRDTMTSRALIESEWFKARWPHVKINRSRDKVDSQTRYYTTNGGERYATSIPGGRLTGNHFHTQVIDDPTKPRGITGVDLENAWDWFSGTASTRIADASTFCRVIIMQRLHEGDLVGRLKQRDGVWTVSDPDPKKWVHLKLPMEFRAADRCQTPVGGDWRTDDGELLCPERFPPDTVAELKKSLGPLHTAAQLGQDPVDAAGGIFKRDWMEQRWRELPARGRYVQFWDCAFKAEEDGSYVVGQLWLYYKAQFFLVDQVRDHMDLPATVSKIKDLRHKPLWNKTGAIVVEDKANGPAVLQTLGKVLPGMVPWSPGTQSKVERANSVAVYFEAGNVWLPEKHDGWVSDYVEEMAKFPRATNDDQVDATSGALLYLTRSGVSRMSEAMAQVRKG